MELVANLYGAESLKMNSTKGKKVHVCFIQSSSRMCNNKMETSRNVKKARTYISHYLKWWKHCKEIQGN